MVTFRSKTPSSPWLSCPKESPFSFLSVSLVFTAVSWIPIPQVCGPESKGGELLNQGSLLRAKSFYFFHWLRGYVMQEGKQMESVIHILDKAFGIGNLVTRCWLCPCWHCLSYKNGISVMVLKLWIFHAEEARRTLCYWYVSLSRKAIKSYGFVCFVFYCFGSYLPFTI